MGLLGFYGKINVNNIPKPLSFILHKYDSKKEENEVIVDKQKAYIDSGNYSIKEIEEMIRKKIKEHYPQYIKENGDTSKYFLRLNSNTRKVEFRLPLDINLFPDFTDNLGHLLGFSPQKQVRFQMNRLHLADSLPMIKPYEVIEMHCNIVEPSIANHDTDPHSHQDLDLLYMFHPKNSQNYDSTIAHVPTDIIYVPLNKNIKFIQNIELVLRNEKGRDLDFGNESLTVYLKLINNNDQPNSLFQV